MLIHVARDSRTGFPVLRQGEGTRWVGLMPVTKVQVEQWVADGGMVQYQPFQLTDLMERLEMTCDYSPFPPTVQNLRRVRLASCTRENVVSVLATYLSVWAPDDDTRLNGLAFPTRNSEWGRAISWLHGTTPSTKDWKLTFDAYRRLKTKDLVEAALSQRIGWNSDVERLLQRLLDLFTDDETGLPFMDSGIYELTSDTVRLERLTVDPPETLHRPLVGGESRVWPTLDSTGARSWRPLLQSAMPAVGVRLWFSDAHVADANDNANPRCFEATPVQPAGPKAAAGWMTNSARGRGQLNNYCQARITMANRCPVCYNALDKDSFKNWPVIWCYSEREVGNDKPVRKHNDAPPTAGAIIARQAISQDYLLVARNNPGEVRSVTLSGAAKAGKGMFLLSLTGLMTLPLGRAPFLKAFPDILEFNRTDCSMSHPTTTADHLNVLRQMEDMWVDGLVPIRTPSIREALRYPMLFELSRENLFGLKTRKRLILIMNDIAGEIVNNPVELPANEWFRHIGATTDVIFLVPADRLGPGSQDLGLFANGLGAVQFESQAVNRKQINLILAISQIDKLKHSGDGKLLNIFFRAPHVMPFQPQAAEAESYCAGVREIHYDLERWLGHHCSDLVRAAERFASVRYCGFSSVGFDLIKKKR